MRHINTVFQRLFLIMILLMVLLVGWSSAAMAADPQQAVDDSRCLGYTLYTPSGPGSAVSYLLDMNGTVVHEWSITGNPVKMLPGGSLVGAGGVQRTAAKGNPDVTEVVQISWDGQKEWGFSNWIADTSGTGLALQHHDYQREGNPVGYYAPGQDFVVQGNTLILAHEDRYLLEISPFKIQDDVIYEVDWAGNLTGFVWYAADHFDEMGFDESAKAAIYGGANFDENRGDQDLFHINSMSLLGENHWYDETGDERFNPANIIISSRSANFVAIISRETGKIVWEIGPDFSSGTAEYNLGQFVGQHHAHMIPAGLPGAGDILVFDNGSRSGYGGQQGYPRYRRTYSRVVEFNPVTLEIVWQYGAENGAENGVENDAEHLFSQNVSSAQRLPNGNTLITEGASGRIIEVTPAKEIVWDYTAPKGNQGESIVYRAYRIPPEWVPGNPAGYATWASLYE